ncbi:MAG: MerR family transcriptional regulator, partial [Solobacterium sp.]|nr:MerR family transcriptional regulator [Solobacterium sp.]
MTIKEFARLCGCNPQTLRYYDHVDLLKPIKVDKWSGYRYYDEEQALTFIKIKNLQKAGFIIDEIKELLNKDNQEIFDAFSAKIIEQEERLAEIKKIQMSYQAEMSEMNNKLENIRAFVIKTMQEYDPYDEFGIDQDTYQAMIQKADDYFSERLSGIEDRNFEYDEDDEKEAYDFLNNPEYEIIYEKHGWNHVKDFYEEFSSLEDRQEYALLFKLVPGKAEGAIGSAFATTILGLLLQSNSNKHIML